MSVLTIHVPATPPVKLSPNARIGWAQRARLGKPLREAAYLATRAKLNDQAEARRAQAALQAADRIAVGLLICWERGRKPRDSDNAIASCKQILDGIADGLSVSDRRFDVRGVQQERADRDDAGGWVVVTLEAEA